MFWFYASLFICNLLQLPTLWTVCPANTPATSSDKLPDITELNTNETHAKSDPKSGCRRTLMLALRKVSESGNWSQMLLTSPHQKYALKICNLAPTKLRVPLKCCRWNHLCMSSEWNVNDSLKDSHYVRQATLLTKTSKNRTADDWLVMANTEMVLSIWIRTRHYNHHLLCLLVKSMELYLFIFKWR